MRQAYFHNTVINFLNTKGDEIVGKLNLAGTAYASQWTIATTSWDTSIVLLKDAFSKLIHLDTTIESWHILLEYEIPRLSSRIDAVIIAEDLIFVIEFKMDRTKYELADIRQVEDYALDLNDFHLESAGKLIIPMLLAPFANSVSVDTSLSIESNVFPCIKTNAVNFHEIIFHIFSTYHNSKKSRIDPFIWEQSEYKPTPTIIQAAKALFSGKKVENITTYGADNLSKTNKCLINAINEARLQNKKIVCFVTGVPGAGKTLVGLDIVHEKEKFGGEVFNTAYFSGNGPLINVLREALVRDYYDQQMLLFRSKQILVHPKKKDAERQMKSKIQNLHLFIKDGIRKKTSPDERIVVFDEAQRCWDAKQFSNKAKQNRNRESNPFAIEEKSEAELLFEFMNRHDGWSVIIALVGGGQEINTGEGGIAEWGKALEHIYPNWEIFISPQLLFGDSSTAGQTLFASVPSNLIVHKKDELHLKVSQRSFKASNLNAWVNALIENRLEDAFNLASSISESYPLFITRRIDDAKEWLRQKKSGTKRIGLVASSGGLRLKPFGIHVREEIDEALWFLNDETDIRSSYYLEMVATEYKVQGLELDWAGICWDADLRITNGIWDYKNFSGTEWKKTNTSSERQFLLNTYRVLLTRAREGIIVFVPYGDKKDPTRLPQFYDSTFDYLKSCGMKEI